MDLRQLRCVVALADTMHFGQAARTLDMLPAAFGRQIRALEEELGLTLFLRTTRTVALTAEGHAFAREARAIVEAADDLAGRFRERGRTISPVIRLGAIDSAAAGLVPALIRDLRAVDPAIAIELTEDKSIRLIPKLLSGRLDLAIVRPGARLDPRLRLRLLLYETAVVALPAGHALAERDALPVADMAEMGMIIPERRSRPHSHDLTMKLFEEAGLAPRIAQIAEEKQTILNMVAAGIGAAIVPLWSARIAAPGVVFRPLSGMSGRDAGRLPLAVAWQAHVRDTSRDRLLDLLVGNLAAYAAEA